VPPEPGSSDRLAARPLTASRRGDCRTAADAGGTPDPDGRAGLAPQHQMMPSSAGPTMMNPPAVGLKLTLGLATR
jgi:hypothetical protein